MATDQPGETMAGLPKVRALHEYKARSQTELSFLPKDILTVHDIVDDNWWVGELDGKQGFIPAAYVEHQPTWMAEIPADGASPARTVKSDAPPRPPAPAPPSAPGAASDAAPADTPTRPPPIKSPAGNGDRPDIAKALKIHSAKAKHKDIAPRSGPNELERHMHRLKKKPSVTAGTPDEFTAALRKRSAKNEELQRKEKAESEMSELERLWKKQASVS